jgi:hypothetical protein
MIRRMTEFKTVYGVPLDTKQCCLTIETIEEHFPRLFREIENLPAGFIFSVYESGLQEFLNCHEVSVMVLMSYSPI